MSKYFDTNRIPLTIEARGKSHTFYIRELGYNHFAQITQTAGVGLHSSARALAVLEAVVLASVEEEDGSKSYTQEEWLGEIKEVAEKLSREVMVAQGIDPDAASEQSTPEEDAKNA